MKHNFRNKGIITEKFVLELYVSSQSPVSFQAIENIKAICNTYLKSGYSLEVIDIEEHPDRAEKANIMAIPTLIKIAPEPASRLIGGLQSKNRVLAGLEIPFN